VPMSNLKRRGGPPSTWHKSLLSAPASTKLTIVSIAALILLSLLGTLLPQATRFSPEELDAWKQDHPQIIVLLQPLGAFRMFSSPLFITVALVVTLNLAVNTALRVKKTRKQLLSKAAATIPVKAHVVIHGGLLLLTLGIALSMLFKLDGAIVLTEGQMFQEGHEAYHSLREGPLFGESHRGYALRLEEFTATYEGDQYPVRYASRVRIAFGPGDECEAGLEVNRPVKIRGVTLTQDVFGFSPLIRIDQEGRELVHAFIALNTFKTPEGMRFLDSFQLSQDRRFVFEIFPDFDGNREDPRSRSHIPRKPAMLLSEERLIGDLWHDVSAQEVLEAGGHQGSILLALGDSERLGPNEVTFLDMRYWSKFRVVQDPYLNIIYAGLWVSLAGLALRYPVAMFVRSRRT
jgi:cytochrome c biogenesis protein ResB